MRLKLAVFLTFFFIANCPAMDNMTLTIPLSGGTGPYFLEHSPIIVETDVVSSGDTILIRGRDYRIDYNNGYIILSDSLPDYDTLVVTFQPSPITVRRSFTRYRPIAYESRDTLISQLELKPRSYGSNLDIFGSKGFAVNIGDIGEPSLTQSLDLNISGQLARDVYIRGSVSDRNFGSSSSGGTRSLDELDKILLSVESKNFRGDFGDLELSGVNGSLLDYQRKLTGLDITANTGGFTGKSSLAFSPGEQVEIFFYGSDGKQGPYILDTETTMSSSLGEVFLPGTEEVYLDGVKLTRGVENDYTIDYYERYVQFMPGNIITSDSRITVKIQLAPEGYRRSFYHINSFYDSGFKIGAQYVGEHDDKANPRNFELGQAERSALAAAGSVQDSAYVSGAKFVGAGEGEYLLVTDSSGNQYYDFVGDNAGDYTVSFSRVGAGEGEYEYAGAGEYLFVGEGGGAYSPVLYYPLPESRDFGSIIIGKPGDIYLNGELAISKYDKNTLSDVDMIQTGIGFSGNLGWKKDSLTFWGKSFYAQLLDMKLRLLDSEFTSPGILNRTEFFREYNIPQAKSYSSERLVEVKSGYKTVSNETIDFGGGYFQNDQYRARRGYGLFNLLVFPRLMIIGSSELSHSEDRYTGTKSDWNKYETGVKVIDSRFKPSAFYRHELNDGLLLSGYGYESDEYEGGVELVPGGGFTTSSKFVYRDQQYAESENQWRKQYDRYSLEQGINYGSSGAKFTGQLNYSRVYQKQSYPDIEKLVRNMGSLKLNYNTPDIGFTFYENINGTGQINRAREYVYVGDGKGDYRRDGEDYVPEQGGDYIEVIRQLGETNQIGGYEISGGLRARLNTKVLTSDKILSRITLDGDFSHRLNLSSDTQLDFEHLVPFSGYDESEMSYKTFSYKQRSTLRLNKAGDYLRHTFSSSRSDGSDYLYENLSDRENSNGAEIKLFSRSIVGVLGAGQYATEKRWLYSGNVDIEKIEARLVPEIRPSRAIRIELPLGYSTEDEKVKDLIVDSYSVGVRTVANFKNIGRLEVDGVYTRVEVDTDNAFVPYVVAGGKKPGDNFNLLVSTRFKLNSYSRIEIRYTYKELGDGYDNSTLKIEARAEF